jgi:hypothetical protein
VNLRDFARDGALGPICLGMTRDRVRDLIGPPDAWMGDGPVETSLIWKYGDVELHFGGGDIWLIHFDDGRQTWSGNQQLLIDPWILQQGLRLSSLENALRGAEISFEVKPDINPGCVRVVTEAGVSFLVCTKRTENTDKLGLLLFGLSDSRA